MEYRTEGGGSEKVNVRLVEDRDITSRIGSRPSEDLRLVTLEHDQARGIEESATDGIVGGNGAQKLWIICLSTR